MKAEILTPSGYCYGVENAIKMALDIKSKHPHQNVYVLGMLVHNEFVCDYLSKNGINTINVTPDKYEDAIKGLCENDVLIFTAHGHNEKLDQVAISKKIITYDAVCPMVQKNLNLIKKALKENKKVLYIGQENHPEAIAATSISDQVLLIPNKLLNKDQINTNKQLFVINQTTLNYNDILKTHQSILALYPNSEIANEVCSATRLRQNSIHNLSNDYDALIVVGSCKSSNTNKLYDIAKSHFPNLTILRIQGKEDIDISLLKGKEKVAVTGGTSTPYEILQLISNYINSIK